METIIPFEDFGCRRICVRVRTLEEAQALAKIKGRDCTVFFTRWRDLVTGRFLRWEEVRRRELAAYATRRQKAAG